MRFVGAPLASALAQLLGFAQIVVLLWDTGPSTESDFYFLLFAWTQLAHQLVLAGVVYPAWLRGRGASATGLRWLATSAVPLSAVSSFAGLLVWTSSARELDSAALISVLFAVQGGLAATYWIGAFWLSAQGVSVFASGATLLPNLLAVALGVGGVLLSAERVPLLILGQCIGFLGGITILILSRGNVWREAWSWEASGDQMGTVRDPVLFWFSAQASAGYGTLLVLQSVTAGLPGNSLSVLGVVQRVQTGLGGVVVNATLPTLLHSSTTSGAMEVRRFLRQLLIGTLVMVAVVTVVLRSFEVQYSWAVPAVGSLFLAASLNASVKRVAARFLPTRLALVTVMVSVAVGVLAVVLRADLTLQLVLLLFAALESIPALALSLRLRWWRLACSYCACIPAGLALGGVLWT